MSTTKNVIRTIYLYLFALVGLALTIIGTVIIVNTVLKSYIFKNADYNYNNAYIAQPLIMDDKFTTIYKDVENTKKAVESIKAKEEKASITDRQLTEEELETLNTWLADYKKWSESETKRQEIESKRNYVLEQREQSMSNALSMIIVGFPVYLIHWIIIIRDIKRNKVNEI